MKSEISSMTPDELTATAELLQALKKLLNTGFWFEEFDPGTGMLSIVEYEEDTGTEVIGRVKFKQDDGCWLLVSIQSVEPK